jgi:hypothetical protein
MDVYALTEVIWKNTHRLCGKAHRGYVERHTEVMCKDTHGLCVKTHMDYVLKTIRAGLGVSYRLD